MLGVGMAEKSGYFEAVLTNVVEKAPKQYILLIIIFAGVIANIAGDAGPIVLPPLAALTFLKIGLNPMAGAVLGYVSSLAAFAANVMLGMSDALVFPFTESAAQTILPEINEPVSAFAKNEFGIKAKTATITIVASNDQFAYLTALISLSDNEPPL